MIGWDELLRHKSHRQVQLMTHISLKHRYVYLATPRTGSSTVKYHLQAFELRATNEKVTDVLNRYASPHVWPRQLPDEDFFAVLTRPDFLRIGFVRNPFSRLLSCYLYRICEDTPSRALVLRLLGRRPDDKVSFDEFVHLVAEQSDPASADDHWAPQTDALFHPHVQLGFVGRFESLVPDLLRLSAVLGGAFDRAAIESVNASPGQTGSRTRLAQYYSDALVALVAKRFADDFAAFGYSTSLPD